MSNRKPAICNYFFVSFKAKWWNYAQKLRLSCTARMNFGAVWLFSTADELTARNVIKQWERFRRASYQPQFLQFFTAWWLNLACVFSVPWHFHFRVRRWPAQLKQDVEPFSNFSIICIKMNWLEQLQTYKRHVRPDIHSYQQTGSTQCLLTDSAYSNIIKMKSNNETEKWIRWFSSDPTHINLIVALSGNQFGPICKSTSLNIINCLINNR